MSDHETFPGVASVCRNCEFCTNGTDELHCPSQKNSGFSVPGTFQQYVATDGRYATRIPEGVQDEEAGPISEFSSITDYPR